MAADSRKYKDREKDKNGSEIILRDAKLVEQTQGNTVGSDDYFELQDADGNFIKIPSDNVYSVIFDAIAKLTEQNNKDNVTSNIKIPVIQGSGNNSNLGCKSVSSFKTLINLGIPVKTISSDTNLDDLGNSGAAIYVRGADFIFNSALSGANVGQWLFQIDGTLKTRLRRDWVNWDAWVVK